MGLFVKPVQNLSNLEPQVVYKLDFDAKSRDAASFYKLEIDTKRVPLKFDAKDAKRRR